jgi:MFS family permease
VPPSPSDPNPPSDVRVGLDPDVVAEAQAEASGALSNPDAAADAVVQDASAVSGEAEDATSGEAIAAAATPTDRRGGSLWRDGNFLTIWTGQALSRFGEQISMLAIPVVAVLLLDANEFQVGVLNAAEVAAFLIVGLPAGAWIDRMRKRRVMIWADVVRAAAVLAIPVLYELHVLQIWQLYLVALVVGVAAVFFDVSYQSLVPSLVRGDQIAEANGKLESTSQIAQLAGPAVSGWLIGVFTAPLAMIVTGFTYVASFVALIFTRDHEVVRAPEEHGPLLKEIGEGLRWVFGNPLLRRIAGTTGVSNVFNTMAYTMLPLFLLRELGFTPAAMGLVLSLGGIGGLLGALLTPRIVRIFGEARTIPLSTILFSLTGFGLPIVALFPAAAFPLLVAETFFASFAVLVYNITQVTFRQRITPPHLLGRMNASMRFVVWGGMPIAALIAGGLGSWLGIVPTLWIAAIGEFLSGAFVVFGPFWTMRDLPQAAADTA